MFPKEIYANRRQALKKKVGSGVILLIGNEESSMNYKDNWYSFRQDSSFLYFVGIDKPGLAVLMDIDQDTETLFGEEGTVDDMIWNGYQKPLKELAFETGINEVSSLQHLSIRLQSIKAKKQPLHFLSPYRPEHTEKLITWLDIPQSQLQQKASKDLIKAIVALRSIKSPEEITEIEKAVNITSEMQLAAIKHAHEGVSEAYLAGKVHGKAISSGGNLSFPIILTVNGEILHNHYSNKSLEKDQMVLCDCGAETNLHYAGDLTRTFPVNKKFSTVQKELYNIVLSAHLAAAAALKPGIPFKEVHLLACEKLTEGLQQLGLMKGHAKEAVAVGAHTLFFPCGLGHMMGLDVHDMENLGEEYVGYTEDLKKSPEFGLKSLRLGKALEEGFVLTIEPGLYFNPILMDIWAAEKKHEAFINYGQMEAFRNVGGIRIEDDFLVTGSGSQLLGDPLPKTAEAMEELRYHMHQQEPIQ
jgi:Xaa-Pro aminopeptidase